MAGDKVKTPKGAPKLKRSNRAKARYAAQFLRTYHNKLRRVRKHNGEAAAMRYMAEHSLRPQADPLFAETPLPGRKRR